MKQQLFRSQILGLGGHATQRGGCLHGQAGELDANSMILSTEKWRKYTLSSMSCPGWWFVRFLSLKSQISSLSFDSLQVVRKRL